MMKSKPWRIARNALLVVALLGSSLWLWAHLTRQALADERAAEQARADAEYNKRYPVKGRRTKEKVAPLPPPIDGPGLTPAAGPAPERPRMRISRGEDQ